MNVALHYFMWFHHELSHYIYSCYSSTLLPDENEYFSSVRELYNRVRWWGVGVKAEVECVKVELYKTVPGLF